MEQNNGKEEGRKEETNKQRFREIMERRIRNR
jgi:hypothetical protein